MIATELSRPHRLDQIGTGESRVDVTADPAERVALATRFGLIAIDSLVAHFLLRRDAAGIIARGHLSAKVVQACIVTEAPLPASIEEDFAIRFLPEGEPESEEVELSEDDCDTVFYTGGTIDLGEAAAETLALSLDPFPRSPEAAAVLKEAGVISEDEVEPSGPLSGLKDLLSKKR
jgi:uncharacterized metal-binding protein YceD (DUF177 family)